MTDPKPQPPEERTMDCVKFFPDVTGGTAEQILESHCVRCGRLAKEHADWVKAQTPPLTAMQKIEAFCAEPDPGEPVPAPDESSHTLAEKFLTWDTAYRAQSVWYGGETPGTRKSQLVWFFEKVRAEGLQQGKREGLEEGQKSEREAVVRFLRADVRWAQMVLADAMADTWLTHRDPPSADCRRARTKKRSHKRMDPDVKGLSQAYRGLLATSPRMRKATLESCGIASWRTPPKGEDRGE